ncbi:MAG: tetratricopeptide repeat protein [Candidatus Dormibacteria bacterium]
MDSELTTTHDICGTAPGFTRRVIALRKHPVAALALAPLLAGIAACGTSPATPAQAATTLVTQGLKAQLSGDLATAASDYQQAIHLDGSNMVAHYDLGTVFDQQRSTAAAVAQYQAALVINPTFPDALFNLAVDTAGTNPQSATVLYSRVVALQPTFAAAWLNLGFALMSQGQAAQAKADWAKAIVLDPTLATRLPKATSTPSPSPTATPKP